jgi:hypothetical protein
MNTYNESLKNTTDAVLAGLTDEKTKLQAEQATGEFNLYYAQGAQLAASDKLHDDVALRVLCNQAKEQSLRADDVAGNLLATVTMANTDVGASATNMATAAANVQIASNAIVALSQNIGGALNNAVASLYGTEIYKQLFDANNLINDVANDCKHIAMMAMDATSATADISAQALLTQTKAVGAKIDTLLATTQGEVDKQTALGVADRAALATASRAEGQAESALLDIDGQARANRSAYANASRELNMGLSVKVESGKRIEVACLPLDFPLRHFSTQPAAHVPAPGAVYFLTLVPLEQSATFSIAQAAQLFATRPDGDNAQFHRIEPGSRATGVDLTLDAFGNKVKAGNPYVAYVYVELAHAYKRFISDFDDLLSSPSQSFVPATTLPRAQRLGAGEVVNEGHLASVKPQPLARLHFSALALPHDVPAPEFRCILIEEGSRAEAHLMRNHECMAPPIYFSVAIAEQVAPGNYEKAQRVELSTSRPPARNAKPESADGNAPEDTGDADVAAAADITGVDYYVVTIQPTTTDNFGNMLRPGTHYKPMILTVMNNDHANKYVSVLSDALPGLAIPSGH